MQFLRDNFFLFLLLISIPFLILQFDREIFTTIKSIKGSSPSMEPLWQTIYLLTKWVGHGTTVVIIAIFSLIVGRLFNKNLLNAGKVMLLVYAFSGITVQLFKHLIGRARPRVTIDPLFIGPSFKSGFDSFPSGHTTVIFCIAYVLAEQFPSYRYFFYSFAIFVALERVWHGSHFPSDVLAGAVLGIICGKILIKVIIPKLNYRFKLLRI